MDIKSFLEENDIEHNWHEHPAVFTCEEADKHCSHIPGLALKNLFLKDKKGRRFFLFITTAEKRVDLKKLAESVEMKKITFANTDELKEKLNLTPGAVSPFGLLNDENGEVDVFIDKEVMGADILSFHPNINTASVEITSEMFKKFLNTINHDFKLI